MPTTLVSWNLRGSAGPDIAAVVAHLRAEGADLVALQEVQCEQARRIARALGAPSHRWSFKHFPFRTWPEGMAVIGVTRAVAVRTRAVSFRWQPWSWRRRIVQVATVEGGLTLVNVHLSPHAASARRQVEAGTVLALVSGRRGPVVVAGDVNERPGGPVARLLAAAGLRDGWLQHPAPAGDPAAGGPASDPATGGPAGDPAAGGPASDPATGGPAGDPAAGGPASDPHPTVWTDWRPGTTEPPVRQLDHVYVPAGIGAALRLPAPGPGGLARFSAISDHLPLTAVLDC